MQKSSLDSRQETVTQRQARPIFRGFALQQHPSNLFFPESLWKTATAMLIDNYARLELVVFTIPSFYSLYLLPDNNRASVKTVQVLSPIYGIPSYKPGDNFE